MLPNTVMYADTSVSKVFDYIIACISGAVFFCIRTTCAALCVHIQGAASSLPVYQVRHMLDDSTCIIDVFRNRALREIC
jgi:hypothetical protein